MDGLLNINMFDAVVIGLIILLSLKGLLSGFTKEFFNSLALIGAIFIASFYKSEVAQYAKESLGLDFSTKLLELISLLIIFFATFFIVKLIYKLLDSFVLDDNISIPSRLLGMLIKMITLFFIFSLIVYALSSKPQVTKKFKDTLNSSKIYPILKASGAYILNMPSNTAQNSESKESSKEANEESKSVTKTDSESKVSNNNEESSKANQENKTVVDTNTKAEETKENNNTEIKQEEKQESPTTTKAQEEPEENKTAPSETGVDTNTKAEETKENNNTEIKQEEKQKSSTITKAQEKAEENKTAPKESEANSSDKNITKEESSAEHNETK